MNGQRVEGMNAKLIVSSAEINAKGDGKIAGAPATFEYKKLRSTGDATFRVNATLDDAARARAGFDLAPWLTGAVAVKSQGQINAKNESRMDVDADLSGAKIVDLVPGWSKPAGRPGKATFKLSHREDNFRIDDLNVSGSGHGVARLARTRTRRRYYLGQFSHLPAFGRRQGEVFVPIGRATAR